LGKVRGKHHGHASKAKGRKAEDQRGAIPFGDWGGQERKNDAKGKERPEEKGASTRGRGPERNGENHARGCAVCKYKGPMYRKLHGERQTGEVSTNGIEARASIKKKGGRDESRGDGRQSGSRTNSKKKKNTEEERIEGMGVGGKTKNKKRRGKGERPIVWGVAWEEGKKSKIQPATTQDAATNELVQKNRKKKKKPELKRAKQKWEKAYYGDE